MDKLLQNELNKKLDELEMRLGLTEFFVDDVLKFAEESVARAVALSENTIYPS